MVSYYTAYQLDFSIGGVMALSGYLPLFKSFEQRLSKASIKTPLLACHGDADSLISPNLAEISTGR